MDVFSADEVGVNAGEGRVHTQVVLRVEHLHLLLFVNADGLREGLHPPFVEFNHYKFLHLFGAIQVNFVHKQVVG